MQTLRAQVRSLAPSVVLLVALAAPSPAHACTTFGFRAQRVMGKSYDWHTAAGLLMVNPRGQSKSGAARASSARWTARYGSVTFNQYGRGFPNGGVNERGLAVEVMWLSSARFGAAAPGQRSVNELSFIQYLLDNAKDVTEAIAYARRVHVARTYARVHYMACDKGGACATFEHVAGRLVVHHSHKKKSLPYAALTNHTYDRSLRYYKRAKANDSGMGSLARFARAAEHVQRAKALPARGAVERAFATLDSVRNGSYSKWQIVYQLAGAKPRVSFRAAGARKRLFTVDLAKVDFRCGGESSVIDLTGSVSGKAGRWLSGANALNGKLVRATLGKLGLPAAIVAQVAAYPRTLRCAK
ncbi:MAG: linear amide C-N hydrolase [Myxococcales bacterium]|nr:linear amide C-N hydrolase [Myxococcales bacterium]